MWPLVDVHKVLLPYSPLIFDYLLTLWPFVLFRPLDAFDTTRHVSFELSCHRRACHKDRMSHYFFIELVFFNSGLLIYVATAQKFAAQADEFLAFTTVLDGAMRSLHIDVLEQPVLERCQSGAEDLEELLNSIKQERQREC